MNPRRSACGGRRERRGLLRRLRGDGLRLGLPSWRPVAAWRGRGRGLGGDLLGLLGPGLAECLGEVLGVGDLLERGERPGRGRLGRAAAPAAGLAAAGLAAAPGGRGRRAPDPGGRQFLLERHRPAHGGRRSGHGRSRLGRAGASSAGRGLGRCRGPARRRAALAGAAGAGAPPARAAASFSLSVSGRPSGGRRRARPAGAAGAAARRPPRGRGRPRARPPPAARRPPRGVAGPPFRAIARMSFTLGRSAIAQKPSVIRRTTTPRSWPDFCSAERVAVVENGSAPIPSTQSQCRLGERSDSTQV